MVGDYSVTSRKEIAPTYVSVTRPVGIDRMMTLGVAAWFARPKGLLVTFRRSPEFIVAPGKEQGRDKAS